MLVPIGPGHLNIAEALIEVKGKPLPTPELAADLDLPAEVSEEIRNLSVNFALQADERFDNVGDSGRDIWYLRRLTPEQVVNPRFAWPSPANHTIGGPLPQISSSLSARSMMRAVLRQVAGHHGRSTA